MKRRDLEIHLRDHKCELIREGGKALMVGQPCQQPALISPPAQGD